MTHINNQYAFKKNFNIQLNSINFLYKFYYSDNFVSSSKIADYIEILIKTEFGIVY